MILKRSKLASSPGTPISTVNPCFSSSAVSLFDASNSTNPDSGWWYIQSLSSRSVGARASISASIAVRSSVVFFDSSGMTRGTSLGSADITAAKSRVNKTNTAFLPRMFTSCCLYVLP